MKKSGAGQKALGTWNGRAAALMAFVFAGTQCLAPGAHAFDDFTIGARPAAFSGAFTAGSDDVHSLYYNPAGLAGLASPQVTAYYARLLPNLSDGSDAAVTFMAYGQRLRPDGSLGTLALGWNEFRLQDLFKERTVTAGYGVTLPYMMGLSVGANAKVLSRIFGEDADTRNPLGGPAGQSDPVFRGGKSAQKVSFDLGAQANPLPNLQVGASLTNVNTPDLGLSGTDRVPMITRLGAAYRFPFLKAYADFSRRRYLAKEPDTRLAGGFERSWLMSRYGEMAVRAGAGVGSRSWRQVSLGLGYEVNGLGVDYVYVVPLGSFTDTGNTHQISLSFRFGKSPGEEELSSLLREEKEALARAEAALKLAQAEAQFIKEDRNQLLMEMERLKAQVAQGGAPLPTPVADKAGASADREQTARDKAQREFGAAYQAAMAAYSKKVQKGATLVDRIALLDEILAKYADKPVDVSRARAELEKTRSDLAQAEADYKITLDFYRKTVADGAETIERISLLERMSKKYGRAGVDISEVRRELEELKKKQ